MPNIVINVAGEPAGTPGDPRTFAFTKIDTGSPPLVTLTIDDNTGITQWLWEILSQPEGASATLSGATTNTATFTPTAYIPGTYLIRCTFNRGSTYDHNGVAWTTRNLAIRIPAVGEEDEFDTTRGWDPALTKLILAMDAGQGGARQRKVIDYVDNTAAPPTEVSGDRYILDDTGASHADWDGASALDIVEFDGTTWEARTPEEGMVAYVDALDRDMEYVDDGAGAWEERPPGEGYYDNTFNTGSVAGSGGTWTQEVTTGLANASTGIFQMLKVIQTVGTSTDTDIEIWDDDPSGSGVEIYRAAGIDLDALAEHYDPNSFWGDLVVSGTFWLQITNNGSGAATYTYRVRFKNDSP